MSHAPARTDLACRNCGTPAPLEFCPSCGQETAPHPPTLFEFLHEFVGHYVALEGVLWQTLRLLVTRPGQLTREYLEGRRRRYVLPLRLYLTCSFLFFLVVKLTPTAIVDPAAVDASGRRAGAVAERQVPASAASGDAAQRHRITQAVDCGGRGQRDCNWVESLINTSGAGGGGEHSRELVEHMRAHIVAYAPYLVFLMLPVFAGIMKLTYWDRRMSYGEHVVFSLHVHAFWFLLFLAIWLAPAWLADLLELVVPVYGAWAMQVAYGGRWWTTLPRALFASAIYTVLLGVVALAGSVLLLVMG